MGAGFSKITAPVSHVSALQEASGDHQGTGVPRGNKYSHRHIQQNSQTKKESMTKAGKTADHASLPAGQKAGVSGFILHQPFAAA